MRRRLRTVFLTLLGLAIVAAVVGGGAISLVAYRTQEQLVIDSPRGVSEAMYVRIGGIDQWVQMRGQDRDNPVLLWLNGGPGFSTIPATPGYTAWEKAFTVVMWDQRGEGKTFQKYGRALAQSMTIARMAQDGNELAEFLRAHLAKDKIILLGHSWGSILGIHMIRERPDLFHAYVGTGQNVNLMKGVETGYPEVLARARAANHAEAIAALEAVGPPPYADSSKYWTPIMWENRFDGPPRRQPLLTRIYATFEAIADPKPYLSEGADFSQNLMLQPLLTADLPTVGVGFAVPIFFIQGERDIVTPTVLARDYFDRIEAPRKQFIILPNAGHLAIFAARDAFLNELVTQVRPFAVEVAANP